MSAITVVENSISDLVANASLLCRVQSWVSLEHASARLVAHGQKRFCSRAVSENDDQSVREVSQVPSVVALCPRNSVGGDVATSSVETSPDRWRPMIRCQAMASRQRSVKGSRLGREGCASGA